VQKRICCASQGVKKTADLVDRDVEVKLKPLNSQVKTLTVNNFKEFADNQAINDTLGIQTNFDDPCSSSRSAASRISMVCCSNIFPRG
jgi:IS30 family transposase